MAKPKLHYAGPLDTRLIAKAVREGWPMSAENRAEKIAHLRAAVDARGARRGLLTAVLSALTEAEQQDAEREVST